MSDHFAGSPLLLMDLYLVTWILAWGTHALGSDPSRLFDGNALYPATNVIASSEHLLGAQPIFAPVYLATGNPILGLNVVVLSSFVLCCLSMHVLLRSWTGSRLAAFAGSIAFAFAPWRLDLGRPHLLQVQYLPLVALLVDRAIMEGAVRTGLLAGAVIGLQVLCSFSLGYPAFVLAALGAGVGIVAAGAEGRRVPIAALCAMGVGAAVLVLPVVIPYLLAAREGVLHLPASPVDQPIGLILVLAIIGISRLEIALGICGALTALCGRPRSMSVRGAVTMAAAALLGVGLAAGYGGFWHGVIAPFRWLAPVVPGLAYYRVPIRFGYLTSFALATLSGLAVAACSRWIPPRPVPRMLPPVIAIALTAAIALHHLQRGSVNVMAAEDPSHVPAVYHWIARHGAGDPVLELPTGPRRPLLAGVLAARAMYRSTYHWHPLLNGYTGYFPPSAELVDAWASQLPSPRAIELLVKATGVRWIIAHPGAGMVKAPGLVPGLVYRGSFPNVEDGDDRLYEIPNGPNGRRPTWITNPRHTVDGVEAVPVTRPAGTLQGRILGPIHPDRPIPMRFTMINQGSELWPTTPIEDGLRVMLVGRWLDSSGAEVNEFALVVPGDVSPGEALEFDTSIFAPATPGIYTLDVRLRQPLAASDMPGWRQTIDVGA